MSISALTAFTNSQVNWSAAENLTGSNYPPLSNAGNFAKQISITNTIANASAGGGDVFASFLLIISSSSSSNVDLTSITNILQQTGVTLARVKSIVIRLLSTTDDPVNGTAASSIIVGNNGSNDWISQAGAGWFTTAGSELTIPNGGVVLFGTPSAAGVLVDSTHKIIKIANSDGALNAAVQVTLLAATT